MISKFRRCRSYLLNFTWVTQQDSLIGMNLIQKIERKRGEYIKRWNIVASVYMIGIINQNDNLFIFLVRLPPCESRRPDHRKLRELEILELVDYGCW
jgi:hypothetical protein